MHIKDNEIKSLETINTESSEKTKKLEEKLFGKDLAIDMLQGINRELIEKYDKEYKVHIEEEERKEESLQEELKSEKNENEKLKQAINEMEREQQMKGLVQKEINKEIQENLLCKDQ